MFSVTPPSLFSPDGSLHSTKEKSVIAEELFKLQVDEEIESEPMDTDIRQVAVIDGIAFVNKVNVKKNHIQNCEEFASCFIDIIDKETAENHEVRIVFDYYQKNSLRGNTRQLVRRDIQQFITKSLMQQKSTTSIQKIFCLRSKPKKN